MNKIINVNKEDCKSFTTNKLEPSLDFEYPLDNTLDLNPGKFINNNNNYNYNYTEYKEGVLSKVLKSNIKDNASKDILSKNQETNNLIRYIPELTDMVCNSKTTSLNKSINDMPLEINYSVKKFLNNEYVLNFNILEKEIHLEITNKYNNSSNIVAYKEFWMFLYNLHEQGLFYKQYYVSWLITWISSLDKEKINVLCFPFIWKLTCELTNEEIFEIIKPNLNALLQLKEISLIFNFLESINLAGIYLPQKWLENYLKFNDTSINKNLEIPKNFLTIIKNNKEMQKISKKG